MKRIIYALVYLTAAVVLCVIDKKFHDKEKKA